MYPAPDSLVPQNGGNRDHSADQAGGTAGDSGTRHRYQRAVDNVVAALREDGVYEDHAIIGPGLLTGEERVQFDLGGWISGPCLDEPQ